MNNSDTIVLSVKGCSSCGENHKNMVFTKCHASEVSWLTDGKDRYKGQCPCTGRDVYAYFEDEKIR